jgi:co-chaperonin GroES (HSP10)
MRHGQDTHKFSNGKKLRMLGSNVLIRKDREAGVSESGLIHFPDGAMEHVINTGEVLAFGSKRLKDGSSIPIPELEVGMHVAFTRFLAEQDSNKQIRALFGEDDVIKIGPTDILVAWPKGVDARIGA